MIDDLLLRQVDTHQNTTEGGNAGTLLDNVLLYNVLTEKLFIEQQVPLNLLHNAHLHYLQG